MTKASEPVAAHQSSLIKYCDACYSDAVSRFDQNSTIKLCKECLRRREEFIALHHSNQTPFVKPQERLWEPGDGDSLSGIQDHSTSKCEVDDHFKRCSLRQKDMVGGDETGRGSNRGKRRRVLRGAPFVGGSKPIPTPELVFGVLSTVGIYAGLLVQVHSTRNQMRRENAVERDIELGQLDAAASPAEPGSTGGGGGGDQNTMPQFSASQNQPYQATVSQVPGAQNPPTQDPAPQDAAP
jgi:hypothetical protein